MIEQDIYNNAVKITDCILQQREYLKVKLYISEILIIILKGEIINYDNISLIYKDHFQNVPITIEYLSNLVIELDTKVDDLQIVINTLEKENSHLKQLTQNQEPSSPSHSQSQNQTQEPSSQSQNQTQEPSSQSQSTSLTRMHEKLQYYKLKCANDNKVCAFINNQIDKVLSINIDKNNLKLFVPLIRVLMSILTHYPCICFSYHTYANVSKAYLKIERDKIITFFNEFCVQLKNLDSYNSNNLNDESFRILYNILVRKEADLYYKFSYDADDYVCSITPYQINTTFNLFVCDKSQICKDVLGYLNILKSFQNLFKNKNYILYILVLRIITHINANIKCLCKLRSYNKINQFFIKYMSIVENHHVFNHDDMIRNFDYDVKDICTDISSIREKEILDECLNY